MMNAYPLKSPSLEKIKQYLINRNTTDQTRTAHRRITIRTSAKKDFSSENLEL